MTIAELSQFYHITREIADLRRRIRELELKVQPGAARMSGMPGGGGVADPTGDLAAEIVADEVHFCGDKPSEARMPETPAYKPAEAGDFEETDDDELPF